MCVFDGSEQTTTAGVEKSEGGEQQRTVVEDMQNLDVRMLMCDKKGKGTCSGRRRGQRGEQGWAGVEASMCRAQ